eukprot:CAMPEP_0201636792 /NCGR_PEP_ID=MMETSP0493-20130528/9826_1 /ASSEMBLY_ACC=CAM_ASM_000838 /TAXON_ID=420259 /ORGANISM="Thalassiosira gravida, Strain GMp14c1" /LENGTH=37 /DNA_ID= /DNA_START= /DNA_END= /DNA_ORIENTATION=
MVTIILLEMEADRVYASRALGSWMDEEKFVQISQSQG